MMSDEGISKSNSAKRLPAPAMYEPDTRAGTARGRQGSASSCAPALSARANARRPHGGCVP